MKERELLTLNARVDMFINDVSDAALQSCPEGVSNLFVLTLGTLNVYAEVRNAGLECKFEDRKPISINPISKWGIIQKQPLIYRTKTVRHRIYVGGNGSFEIYFREYDYNQSQLILTKPGLDGRRLEQLFRHQAVSA